MCLITINTADTLFTSAWLLDFYRYNADGLGVMYAEAGELFIEKFVPKSEKQVLNFYRTHVDGREAVVHWRMRTHGATNTDNAHPYEVLNKAEHGLDLWMMHNGILSGVASDVKEMSDTWHFIRDTLKPLLAQNVDLLRNLAFIELLEDRIGCSNKLVFLDNLGRRTIINEAAFTDFSGARLSNTYAWSSHAKHNTAFPEEPIKSYLKSGKKGNSKDYRSYQGYSPYQGSNWWSLNAQDEEDDPNPLRSVGLASFSAYEDLENTVYEYPEAVASLLHDYGITAADIRSYFTEEVSA